MHCLLLSTFLLMHKPHYIIVTEHHSPKTLGSWDCNWVVTVILWCSSLDLIYPEITIKISQNNFLYSNFMKLWRISTIFNLCRTIIQIGLFSFAIPTTGIRNYANVTSIENGVLLPFFTIHKAVEDWWFYRVVVKQDSVSGRKAQGRMSAGICNTRR